MCTGQYNYLLNVNSGHDQSFVINAIRYAGDNCFSLDSII